MNASTLCIKELKLPPPCRTALKSFEKISHGCLSCRLPNGTNLNFGTEADLSADVQIHNWRAFSRILAKGDIGVAECFRDGWLSSSDLTALVRLGLKNEHVLRSFIVGSPLLKIGNRIRHWLNRNSRGGSSRNIQAHYDLGNDFYKLWLDQGMSYSSGLFAGDKEVSLDQAQCAKYQRILDLSNAKPGQRILEIGCGWGAFAEYAAKQGIRVHGITLSHEQLKYARERIFRRGLGELVTLELCDYRDLKGKFDHIVSIEMFEAVGKAYWPAYFETLKSRVWPGGSIVIQTITIAEQHYDAYQRDTDFIQQYIFPGGMLPTPEILTSLASRHGMQVSRVDGFATDYAETLRRWRYRFQAQIHQVYKLGFDTRFIRLWLFYLAYCEAGFEEQRIDVLQVKLLLD